MAQQKRFGPRWLAALLCFVGLAAHAQTDYSAYGVADFSYGRFEPSGLYREYRVNSNSLTASFAGVNLKHGLENGLTPGITLETFVRFQTLQTGRSDRDPLLSRNAFVSLNHRDYGLLRVGRLQTSLFNITSRFNALQNSVGFSPAVRHIFASGNLEGVQGDFYWNRAVGYTSPTLSGITADLMYSQGNQDEHGDQASASVVMSRGLLAMSLATQRVHFNDGIADPTDESTWQLGAAYNFGVSRAFGQFTQTRDKGLDVNSKTMTGGVSIPVRSGSVLVQVASTKATGPAVDRKHTSFSAAYVYEYDSVTDVYLIGMDDRVVGQTQGQSAAIGVRYRF